MPTLETDEPERSVPLALQNIFYKVNQEMDVSLRMAALQLLFSCNTKTQESAPKL